MLYTTLIYSITTIGIISTILTIVIVVIVITVTVIENSSMCVIDIIVNGSM